jgi:hypothetical protein
LKSSGRYSAAAVLYSVFAPGESLTNRQAMWKLVESAHVGLLVATVLPRAPERLLNNYNFNKQESEISARKTF